MWVTTHGDTHGDSYDDDQQTLPANRGATMANLGSLAFCFLLALLVPGNANAWFFIWIPTGAIARALETDPETIMVSAGDRALGKCAGFHVNQVQKFSTRDSPFPDDSREITRRPESPGGIFHTSMADMAVEKASEKDKVKDLANAYAVRWSRVASADINANRQYGADLARGCIQNNIPFRIADYSAWQAQQNEKKRGQVEEERTRAEEAQKRLRAEEEARRASLVRKEARPQETNPSALAAPGKARVVITSEPLGGVGTKAEVEINDQRVASVGSDDPYSGEFTPGRMVVTVNGGKVEFNAEANKEYLLEVALVPSTGGAFAFGLVGAMSMGTYKITLKETRDVDVLTVQPEIAKEIPPASRQASLGRMEAPPLGTQAMQTLPPSKSIDFTAEAKKSARILNCITDDVRVIGIDGQNILFAAACEAGQTLLLTCDQAGLCLRKVSGLATQGGIANTTYPDLMTAVMRSDKDAVTYFLSRGANINERANGTTYLNAAAQTGDLEMVKFLVSKGADVNQVDTQGIGPMVYALSVRPPNPALIQFLRSVGARNPFAAR